MKKNRIAAVMVIVLGSLSFWLIVRNGKGTIKEELRDFAFTDTASITKIFLADKKGRTVSLDRKSDGVWTVNNKYTARQDAIITLLFTICKVDVKEPVGKNAMDNVVKQLSAKALRCEIYTAEGLVKAYYVGSETADQTGTYMILMDPETMETSEKPFVTYIPGFEGYLTTRYFTEESGWRDRTVFQYIPSDIASIKMESPFNPELGYELIVKGNNDYQIRMLKDNKMLEGIDTFAVKQYLSYFQQLNFETFEVHISEKQIDSIKNAQPINIMTVTDNKGKSNKVKFFAKKPKQEGLIDPSGKPIIFDPDRMDALLDNGKDFVIVQYYMFGKVMPPPQYFLRSGQAGSPPSAQPGSKPKT